jgi:hypothetical protein
MFGLSACPGLEFTTDDESDCTAGEEGCVCNDGQCLGELVCLSNLCVENPDDSDTDTDEDSGPLPDFPGEDDDVGDETGDDCVTNSDCGSTEACVEGSCYATDLLLYDVSVVYFLPVADRCGDGIGDDIVELFYEVYVEADLTYVSTFEDCPALWLDVWPYDPFDVLEIDFWEEDIASNDPLLFLCWPDRFDVCGPVPPEILHDGTYQGFIEGNDVELVFVPRLR